MYENIDQDTLAGVLKRHPSSAKGENKKHVHYDDGDNDGESSEDDESYEHSHLHGPGNHNHAGAVNKEAIQIPDTAFRQVTAAERFIATIMTGGSSIHGLTGKALV